MNDIRIQIVDLRRTLLNGSLNAAWAASSCHIHPLGMDMKEAESRVIECIAPLRNVRWRIRSSFADGACVIVFRMEFSIEQTMTGGLG